MATGTKDKAGALEIALLQIDTVLGGERESFGTKVNLCLELLEKSLEHLNKFNCLSRAAVEVQALLEGGRRYVHKFSLNTRFVLVEGERVEESYLKQSVTEEDE